MATTSPDAIWSPDSGDDYALTVDLAAMADTVQDALDSVKTYRVGTDAERLALSGANLFNGLRWHSTDTREDWIYSLGSWQPYPLRSTVPLTNFSSNWSATAGYAPYLVVEGNKRTIVGAVSRGVGGFLTSMLVIPSGHRPPANIFLPGNVTGGGVAYALNIQPDGVVRAPYGGGDSPSVYPLAGSWWVSS